MTIDEARELCQLQLESLMSNPQVTLDSEYIQAERMAIASLEAWEKAKAEIDEFTDIFKDGEFYIKNINVKRIIDKHLSEIKNG